MADLPKLRHPWLVAAWPGMGQVSLSASYYLMSKLGMFQLAEFSPDGLFDVHQVEVRGSEIQPTRRPRSRFFGWRAPDERQRDIVVFIGEAQPPLGKYAFCERLIDFSRDLGVERIFTFAAMATPMHPARDCRVFAAATDTKMLTELNDPQLQRLEEGYIGGLNGVLLGAAADKGMPGICLLGEMPHLFAQAPFPKASLAVLERFNSMAGLELDLHELKQQAEAFEQRLGEVLSQLRRGLEDQSQPEQEEFSLDEPEGGLSPEDESRLESLFEEAARDRSKAYELKNELDRLQVFKDYEDRFLDLFKNQD